MSVIVASTLALLLIVLTPIGTGQGAHRDQILDPLFPHVHIADRATTALRNPRRIIEDRTHGPAFGAGAGAASALPSIGPTPPMPARLTLVVVDDRVRRHEARDVLPSGVVADPPLDPPPIPA